MIYDPKSVYFQAWLVNGAYERIAMKGTSVKTAQPVAALGPSPTVKATSA